MRRWAQLQSTAGKAKVLCITSRTSLLRLPARLPEEQHTAPNRLRIQQSGTCQFELDRFGSKVADVLSSYWVNFAAYGDPDGKGSRLGLLLQRTVTGLWFWATR